MKSSMANKNLWLCMVGTEIYIYYVFLVVVGIMSVEEVRWFMGDRLCNGDFGIYIDSMVCGGERRNMFLFFEGINVAMGNFVSH